MSEQDLTPAAPDAPEPETESPFAAELAKLRAEFESREKSIVADFRKELDTARAAAGDTAEPVPAAGETLKNGAVCNQCSFDSREPEKDESGEAKTDRDADTEFGIGDLLGALDHNAKVGHHVTLWLAEKAAQLAPRVI
jgi:hypothetical protein